MKRNILERLFGSLNNYPRQRAPQFFYLLAYIGGLPMRIPWLGPILGTALRRSGHLLTIFSPSVLFDLRDSDSLAQRYVILKYSFPLTLFFCLIMNAILTIRYNTFIGDDPHRMYYIYDYFNLFLYLIVTPSYVTLGICLIYTTLINWRKLKNLADHAQSVTPDSSWNVLRYARSDHFRMAVFLFISIFMTGWLTSDYINEILTPRYVNDILMHGARDNKIYWFITETASRDWVLNGAGAYYLLMNAILLFIAIVSAFCYLSMSIEVVRLGYYANYLRDIGYDDERLASELGEFCWAYCLAKGLILFYALNQLIWGWSPLGDVQNADIAAVALAFIGLLVVPFPRLYLEYKWFKRLPLTGDKYKDLRNHTQAILSQITSFVFIFIIFYVLDERYRIHSLFWAFAKSVLGGLGS